MSALNEFQRKEMPIQTKCPACGYERTPSDQNPVNQCPSCKIIYSRHRAAAAATAKEDSSEPKVAKKSLAAWRPFGQHPGIVFLMMAVVFAAAWTYGSISNNSTPKPPVFDEVSAQLACQTFVSARLKAPASASFAPFREQSIVAKTEGKFSVSAWVDSQNSFGAMLRTRYLCEVQFVGTQAQLLDLFIDK